MIDLTKVCDVEVEGIDRKDHPEYCNAYISSGIIEISRDEYNLCQGTNQIFHNGKYYRDLTEKELDYINDKCGEFVYKKIEEHIY